MQLVGSRIIMDVNNNRNLHLFNALSNQSINDIEGKEFEWLVIESGDWNGVDFSPYASRIKKLKVQSKISDFSIFNGLNNLEAISIGNIGCSKIAYNDFKKLNSVSITGNVQITDSLFEINNIEHLTLRGWSAKDCYHLSNFPRLKSLELVDCRKMVSLSGVEAIDSFESLKVQCSTKLENISDIKKLSNLKRLHIEGCKSISSYAPISNMSNLLELFIISSNSIKSLEFLENLKSLDRLNLANTPILNGKISDVLKAESLRLFTAKDRKINDMKVRKIQELLVMERGSDNDWSRNKYKLESPF